MRLLLATAWYGGRLPVIYYLFSWAPEMPAMYLKHLIAQSENTCETVQQWCRPAATDLVPLKTLNAFHFRFAAISKGGYQRSLAQRCQVLLKGLCNQQRRGRSWGWRGRHQVCFFRRIKTVSLFLTFLWIHLWLGSGLPAANQTTTWPQFTLNLDHVPLRDQGL